MDLEDAFAWKEERTLSQALTLQYDKDISFDPKIYLVNDLMSTIAKPSVTFSDRLQPLAVSEMPLAVRCSIGPRRGCARTCCCGSIGVSRRVSVEERTVIPFRSAGDVEDREPTPEGSGKSASAVARGKAGGPKGGRARNSIQ